MSGKSRAALEGIKVIDLTQFESGTVCTETLAWLGADVYKFERPKAGELGRYSMVEPGVDTHGFIIMNANKKSVTLNLKDPEGKELLKSMIGKADVFIENMGPGSIDRLGFDYETVNKLNPRIVYAQIKGFGTDGPWADFPAFNPIAQAAGGGASITGDPEGPPMQTGFSLADSGSGYMTALSICAALYQRENTGVGQRIEVTMQDTVIGFCRSAFEQQLRTNKPAPRVGNGMPLEPVSPAGMYACKPFGPNDYVHIYASRHPGSKQWANILKVIGKTEFMDDPRFVTPQSRYGYREEIDAMILAWTSERTKVDAMEEMCRADVPAGATMSTEDILNDPYLKKRGIIAEVHHPERGSLFIPGFVPKMSDSQVTIKTSPGLGEHNDEVYKDLLKLSDEKYSSLKEKGVI